MCDCKICFLLLAVLSAPEEKADPPQAMNALMRLNQLKPGLQYKLVSQTGPVHVPVFTMAVEVDGMTFEASGPSKRTAKLHVAVKVSTSFTGNSSKKYYILISSQAALFCFVLVFDVLFHCLNQN